jgi:hypothetical protein
VLSVRSVLLKGVGATAGEVTSSAGAIIVAALLDLAVPFAVLVFVVGGTFAEVEAKVVVVMEVVLAVPLDPSVFLTAFET